MIQDKDQFGCYRVGEYKFYSKIEAIEMQRRTGMHLHWDFNDQIYGLQDWTKEPVESLADLYKRRAQQIRDKYDYIVLFYSSGSDSNNVLQSFLDNDIWIDEIASFVNYEGTHDKDDILWNGEIYHCASSILEQYKIKYPYLKHRVIDICKPAIDYIHKTNYLFEWKYWMNNIFNPSASIRGNMFREITDYQDLINSGKKVAFVWGTDKPRLSIINNKYCFRFFDYIDNAVNPLWQMSGAPGEYMEFFYWSIDMPEIAVKQAHIVKKYLEKATVDSPFLTVESTGLGHTIINGKKLFITMQGVNSLVYPKYIDNELNNFKPSSVFFTPRDNWFYNIGQSDETFTRWKTALSGLWKELPDYWKNDQYDISSGIKGCLSRPYFLE